MAIFYRATSGIKSFHHQSARFLWMQNKGLDIHKLQSLCSDQKAALSNICKCQTPIRSVSIFGRRNSNLLQKQNRRVLNLSSSFNPYHLSILSSQKTQTVDTNAMEYQAIYHFPYIIHAKLLSRAKIYQTGITLIAVPLSLYCYQTGNMSYDNCFWIINVSSFATLMLFVMNRYLQRIVGIISLNNSSTKVKISHLTFWGKKNDLYYDVKDIIPFSDISENVKNSIVHVKTYKNPEEKFYLFMGRRGRVLNVEKFETVFGKLDL